MSINDSYNEEAIVEAIAVALDNFYTNLIKKVDSLNIKAVMKRKNPYLFRAKAMNGAAQIIDAILAAFVSSSEETIFGNVFFEPIATAAAQGQKALAEGVDIMVERDNTIYAIAVKSGTSVFNADSRKKQEQNFMAASKLAQQAKKRFVPIVGYGYGKKKTSNRGLLISIFQERCSAVDAPVYEIFLEHLQNTFGDDWIVLKALKGRIGIHHSLVPKHIQKEIISLFNCGALICLFSTTTITEGVNTSAKNIIITSGKKGTKNLRQFDAKNIAGRAGRFQQHYSGRVIDLNNGFEDIVNREPELLEHKNYDINAPKTDVDYQITKDQYLSGADLLEKESISLRVEASGIPTNVFNSFRVVGPKDKLLLYERIESMPWWTIEEIKRVSTKLARTNARSLHWSGFQTILNLIFPVVREEKLKQLISFRVGDQQQYSLVTVLLSSYLEGGFMSMVDYYTTRRNPPKTKDEAIRTVADFVYNVFKYHLVKYLGLFDVFFRYRVSVLENVDMDSVPGLGLLMQKLEYNALSPTARKVSDYGVPFKLIDCYDSQAEYDKEQFDAYEKRVDEQVSRLFQ